MNCLVAKTTSADRVLRLAINVFIYLILFDGIIRKWIFPTLSYFVMPVKLCVAIFIVIKGRKYLNDLTLWEQSFAFIGLIVFITSLVFGHGNLLVALWGCIPYWFGLHCCFVLAKVVSYEDLMHIGKLFVYVAILNGLLIVIQFVLPVNHILNTRGLEVVDRYADLTAGQLAGGFRPAGIFMSATQNSFFILISSAFLLYFLYANTKVIRKYILYISAAFIVAACVCSVSRTAVFYVIGILSYFIIVFSRYDIIISVLKSLVVIIPLVLVLSMTSVGELALDNMFNRFSSASQSVSGQDENIIWGSLYDIFFRVIVYNVKALFNPETLGGMGVPPLGYGQGMSTQVGGRLLGMTGYSGFSLAEWDGLRIICESGLFFGWIIIILRMGYVLRFFGKISFMRKHNKRLALILLPVFFISFFLLFTWGNATNACFAFLTGGLFMAAYRRRDYFL